MTGLTNTITNNFIEIISLMGKRNVYIEWPNLIPELSKNIESQNNVNCKLALECVKKICKKYRFMFRSDALYNEMNYMIESLSNELISSLIQAIQQMKAATHVDHLVTVLCISNSVLHIIESILSQEELPDFYEVNLPHITQACVEILTFSSPLLNDDKKLTALNKARGKVVRLVHLYQSKFQEHFTAYQDVFFQNIWQLAANQQLNPNKSCETLVQAVIRYMGDCINLPNYSEFIRTNLMAFF